MDDRDLEARLHDHLHRRFDGAQPPPELLAGVAQVVATRPRAVRLGSVFHPGLHGRPVQLGWALVAMAVLAVVAISSFSLGIIGPGSGDPTTAPTAAGPDGRTFLVLADPGSSDAGDDLAAAQAVLANRLRALGFDNLLSATSDWIEFGLPPTGPESHRVVQVLGANGEVSFVPLPRDDYGDETTPGPLVPQLGEPLPTVEEQLFGWEGIASATLVSDEQDRRTLEITLTPAAARAFGQHTSVSVGEYIAILVDGRVGSAPAIQAPVEGGQVSISGSDLPGSNTAEAFAIIAGGRLPVSWRDPQVVEILSEKEVVRRLFDELERRGEGGPAPSFASTELDALHQGAVWQPIWRIVVDGEFRECGGVVPTGEDGCLTSSAVEFQLDAATGERVGVSSIHPTP